MVCTQAQQKGPPDEPFEPPDIRPITTMDDLEAQVEILLATYLHNADTELFHSQVTKLIQQCPQSVPLINSKTINSFKILSRPHGLPPLMTSHLLEPLSDLSADVQFRLKIAHTLKYCQRKNKEFLEGAQVLHILQDYEKKLGVPLRSSLERHLLATLVQIVVLAADRYDMPTNTLLRRSFNMLNAEEKMDVRSLLEAKGLWDAPLHGTEFASVSFLGSEMGGDTDDMKFLSQNLKTSHKTTITTDQHMEMIISEETERCAMLEINIQFTAGTVQEETSSSNVRQERSKVPELPASEKRSTLWEMLERQWSSRNVYVRKCHQKAQEDPSHLTPEDFQYLVDQFYSPGEVGCTDKMILDTLKLASISRQLPIALVEKLLDKTLEMYTEVEKRKSFVDIFGHPIYYDQSLKDQLLYDVLEVIGNQCAMVPAERFLGVFSRLENVEQTIQSSDQVVRGRLKDKTWGILEHQATEEDMRKLIQRALHILMGDQPHDTALNFIVTQVRTRMLSTLEEGVVPAAFGVLKNLKYSPDQRRSAFHILQIHNSNPLAPWFTSDEVTCALGCLEGWAWDLIPCFVFGYLNRNPPIDQQGNSNELMINTNWRFLNSCTELLDLGRDLHHQAQLIVTIDKLFHYDSSRADLSARSLKKIAQLLKVKKLIFQDGSVGELKVESSRDKAHVFFSTMAAKILVDFATDKTLMESLDCSNVVEVAQALNDDGADNMTRIYCSEYLLKASSFHPFSPKDLEVLRKCTEDPIIDIRIYSRVAYTRSLKKIQVIPAHHVYHLPSVYAFARARSGCNDFTDEINSNILTVFQHATDRVELNIDILQVLVHSVDELLQNCPEKLDRIAVVLKMVDGSLKKSVVEGNSNALTVNILELAVELVEKIFMSLDDFNDDCCRMMLTLLEQDQWMSPAVAKKCLEIARSPKVGNHYIRCLWIAAELEDLPQNIFNDFHVELVGKRFAMMDHLPKLTQHQEALSFLHKQLENGHSLSQSNLEVIVGLCLRKTLTELAQDCVISACTNGQHLDSSAIEAAFHAASLEKKVKLAKILVQRHMQLPNGFVQILFRQETFSLSTSHDELILDLVVTMIQYNYAVPEFVLNHFDAIAMNSIQTIGNPQSLPTSLIFPALACLMDRKLIKVGRLPKWRDELLHWTTKSPSKLDLALDVILKLPDNLITKLDIDQLTVQALNPSAPQASRNKLYKAKRGNSLYQVLLLFTRPNDIDDITSAICLYIAKQIQLELPHNVCSRLEDAMMRLPKVSCRIADQVQAVPKKSPKHQLKKLADVAFSVELSTTNDQIRGNCSKILQVLSEFGIRSSFVLDTEPKTHAVDDIQDEESDEESDFSAAMNTGVEITWTLLSKFMKHEQIQLSELNKLAMQVPKYSQNLTPRQIHEFLQFSFQVAQDQEPTIELVKLWYHFLGYEASADVRALSFSALASTREIRELEYWDVIVKNQILKMRAEIYGDCPVVDDIDDKFATQLAHTLYSLDYWDFKQLRNFPNSDDWIPQLTISDLVERCTMEEYQKAELYINIHHFLQTGGNLNCLRTFILLNASDAANKFKIPISTLIQLCNDCVQLTGQFNGQTLPSLIRTTLSEKIKIKIIAPPRPDKVNMLADQLLLAARNNYSLASELISAIQSTQEPIEFFQIIVVFREMTSEDQEKSLDILRSSKINSANELRVAIRTQNLMEILGTDSSSHLGMSMRRKLGHLLNRDFRPEPLLKLFSAVREQKTTLNDIESIIHLLYQYNVDCSTFESHLDRVINSSSPKSCACHMSKLIHEQIHSNSSDGRVRDCDQLLQELRHPLKNPNARLPDTLESMMRDLLDGSCDNKKYWSRESIGLWANDKGSYARTEDHVAVINRALKIHKGWNLTPVQVLSILIALEKSNDHVQLQQVATGTGKSAIIASVAVVKALRGQKVDIYTSSPVLAERDAKEWTPFYAMFGLTCSSNIEKGGVGQLRGRKPCYGKNIVYGDMSQFQFDALKTFYSGLETRGNRQFGCALVDEVDSMCIDDSSKLSRLSSTFPGMDLLHIAYQQIWHQLRLINSRMMIIDGKYHFIISEEDTEEVKDLEKFVRKKLVNFIQDSIINPSDGFKLPQHLRTFAKIQADTWVDSAIAALDFRENEHYILDEGKVKPVDFLTTGVIQSSTNWNNGLHPFLQIKHSLRVTPETVTTNFMSNREILSRYSSNVIGFTGTLGSDKSKEILQQAYNADSVIIPEMFFKRFKQLDNMVTSDQKEWTDQIVYNALQEASMERGVLVICQTIREARQIANEIRRANNSSTNPEVDLVVYVRSDEEHQVTRVRPRTVIVATNLGTRGMDVEASDVESNGGLHVILTYLPDSLRVQEQAFGRTSRQGNRGTGQLVVMGVSTGHSDQISSLRDAREGERLLKFVEQELPVIKLKDELFTKFCKCYTKIRESLHGESILPSWTTAARRLFGLDPLSQHDYAVLQAIEERWALFLKKMEEDARCFVRTKSRSFHEYEIRATVDYAQLEGSLMQTYRDMSSTFASVDYFYWIRCGNELYQRDGKLSLTAAKSIEYFNRAAQHDGPIAPALVGRAVARLKSSGTWQCKEESLKDLEKAQRVLNEEILQYRKCQVLQLSRPGCASSELHKQLEHKIQLVHSYQCNVLSLIDVITKSLRRVHLTSRTTNGDSITTILHPGTIISADSDPDYNMYALKFHHLTTTRDMSTIDQAINTIEEAFNYENICPLASFTIKICPELVVTEFKEEMKDFKIFIASLNDFKEMEDLYHCTLAKQITLKATGTPSIVCNALSLPIFAQKNVELTHELLDEDGRWCKTLKTSKVTHGNKLICSPTYEKTTASFDVNLAEKNLDDLFKIPNLLFSVEVPHINIEELSIDGWISLLDRHDDISITLKTSDRSNAIKIVQQLREQHIDFALELNGLKYEHAKYVWGKTDCREELFEQQNLDLLSKRLPDSELGPMISRGMDLLPQFVEKNFVPWKSLIAMVAIGGSQVALGLALSSNRVCGLSGFELISEGISDILMTAADWPNFGWKKYGMRKVIGLTAKLTALKLNELATGSRELLCLTPHSNQGAGTGPNLIPSAFRMIADNTLAQAATTVACERLGQVYNSLSKFSFEQIREPVFLKVLERVQWEMEAKWEDLFRFLALESIRGSNQPLKKIKIWISKIPKSNVHVLTNAISAGQELCSVLQKFYTCEHLKTAITCFKITSIAIAAIAGLSSINGAVRATCEHINSCIFKEIYELPITTILSFTLTSQEVEQAKELFTFDNAQDFGEMKMSPVNAQMSEKTFQLFEKITDAQQKYDDLKQSFIEDTEVKPQFTREIAEYITSFIVKTANESMWTPESQGSFMSNILVQARKYALMMLQDDSNPSEDANAGCSVANEDFVSNHGVAGRNAIGSGASEERVPDRVVGAQAEQTPVEGTLQETEMEVAIRWVRSRDPQKPSFNLIQL